MLLLGQPDDRQVPLLNQFEQSPIEPFWRPIGQSTNLVPTKATVFVDELENLEVAVSEEKTRNGI